ncbi:MAG: HAD family hydrolase [Prevotella sp.]|nr:HAD family hydrolase [Prevotella sp.]
MRYDTFIFDLDGTLLDTLTDLANSCNYALRTFNMPERTVDEVRQFVGNGVRRLMQRAIPDGDANPLLEDVLKAFREHYMLHQLDNTHPYPDVMQMLTELRKREAKLAVVSNKFYNATTTLCQHFFNGIIDVAIGEREDIRKKPAPDTVNEALRQLNARRETAIYIGDSDVDIMTATNAGIPCASVLWGFRDKEFLMEHGATLLIANPMELLDI